MLLNCKYEDPLQIMCTMRVTHCTLTHGLEDKVPVRGSVGADITLCLAVLYSSMKTAAWLSPSDIISPHSDTSYLVSSI